MLHDFYTDFIEKYNIRNGELASQTQLNEAANMLKKEIDDLYNRSEIIRGEMAFEWRSQTPYIAGEMVSYEGKNYIVKEDMESMNELPSLTPTKWEETLRADWTMELDPNGYIHIDNTGEYNPVGDYNPATKKYVDDEASFMHVGLDGDAGVNFLPLEHGTLDVDHILDFEPTENSHPSTKKYVDDEINKLASGDSITVSNTRNAEALGLRSPDQYITLEKKYDDDEFADFNNLNGMAVKNGDLENSINASDFIRTTESGLLPHTPDNPDSEVHKNSSLGAAGWTFKAVHAETFYGNIESTDADLAEKYEADANYAPGIILGIGTDTEVTVYREGLPLAGVVSSNPAHRLNTAAEYKFETYIALKGRVPVKIHGSAERGDYINASSMGYGIAGPKGDLTIGVCINGGTDEVEVKI